MTVLRPHIPPNIDFCSVDFDDVEFRRVLVQKGTRAWWEGFVECPCRELTTIGGMMDDTGTPDKDCIECSGSGALYIPGQQIPVMRMNAKTRLEWFNAMGPLAHGHAMFTLLPEHMSGFRDRFTLLDGVMVFTERKVREATVEQPRYPIIRHTSITGTAADLTVPETTTVGVLYAHGTGLDGVVTQRLVEGTDFSLVPLGDAGNGHTVDWTIGDGIGSAPPVGARYTLRYYARPRFVVVEDTFAIRGLYHWGLGSLVRTDYATLVLVALEHLAGGPGDNAPQGTDYSGGEGQA